MIHGAAPCRRRSSAPRRTAGTRWPPPSPPDTPRRHVAVEARGDHADQGFVGEEGELGFGGRTDPGEEVGGGADLGCGEDRGAGAEVGGVAEGRLLAGCDGEDGTKAAR